MYANLCKFHADCIFSFFDAQCSQVYNIVIQRNQWILAGEAEALGYGWRSSSFSSNSSLMTEAEWITLWIRPCANWKLSVKRIREAMYLCIEIKGYMSSTRNYKLWDSCYKSHFNFVIHKRSHQGFGENLSRVEYVYLVKLANIYITLI